METGKQTKRRPGRPSRNSAGDDGLVDREKIVDLAYEMASNQSIDQVSFVQLAKAFNVKPGALHYHIGTKDDLASAILNRFYKDLLTRLQEAPEEPNWRQRLSRFAHTLMNSERQHRGAAEHIQTHAKFRVFQKVRTGETDYGAAFLNHAFELMRDAGFDADTAALLYHVLALLCLSTATSASSRLEPSAHEDFLMQKADTFEPGSMPGLEFALRAFARVRTDDAFQHSLDAILDHFGPLRRSQA